MPHPCDRDLDDLDDFLEDLEDEDSERFTRALRSLRADFSARLASEDEEDATTPMADFEAAYERLRAHLHGGG